MNKHQKAKAFIDRELFLVPEADFARPMIGQLLRTIRDAALELYLSAYDEGFDPNGTKIERQIEFGTHMAERFHSAISRELIPMGVRILQAGTRSGFEDRPKVTHVSKGEDTIAYITPPRDV